MIVLSKDKDICKYTIVLTKFGYTTIYRCCQSFIPWFLIVQIDQKPFWTANIFRLKIFFHKALFAISSNNFFNGYIFVAYFWQKNIFVLNKALRQSFWKRTNFLNNSEICYWPQEDQKQEIRAEHFPLLNKCHQKCGGFLIF